MVGIIARQNTDLIADIENDVIHFIDAQREFPVHLIAPKRNQERQ